MVIGEVYSHGNSFLCTNAGRYYATITYLELYHTVEQVFYPCQSPGRTGLYLQRTMLFRPLERNDIGIQFGVLRQLPEWLRG